MARRAPHTSSAPEVGQVAEDKIGIGIIGYGYWGPNLVRNFYETSTARVVSVSDLNDNRLAAVRSRYPTIKTATDYRDLLKDPSVDAILVATPVATHFPLALEALKAGKHVLVEKPIASTAAETSILIDEASKRELVLMVDHTFVYTSAVRKIDDLVKSGEMGDIYYYDSVRINLGLFQTDVNVIWDLAVHDLTIMDVVIPAKPLVVSATGISHVPGKPENIAYLTMYFDNNVIAHIHVNWLAPVKLRRTLISGSRRMIVYDDIEPSEKIKIYDRGITVSDTETMYKYLIGYRTGDMHSPQLEVSEALKVEAAHFVDCIRNKKRPISDGEAGLRVVRILEAATQSLKLKGHPVELP